MKDHEITWGAYLRLSRLKSRGRKGQRGRGVTRNPDESVERQLRLIRAYADEHGLALADDLILTRLRDQYDRQMASMAARFEATEAELAGLGAASAPAEPLEALTAEEWDDPDVTPADAQARIIRELGLRITIRPGTRAQGASRLPFDTCRVQISVAA